MSNPVPSALALTSIGTGAAILSADHRNNYASIQATVNLLAAALRGGSAGQVLQAVDANDVQWGSASSAAAVGGKIADLGVGADGQVARLRLQPVTYNNGGATALPAATITVGDTTEFPASGTLATANGTITYTGKTATTFTGCTGGVGTLAAAAAVALGSGTPTDGSYEEVALIYDSTLGKWVSDPVTLTSGIYSAGPTTTSATFVEMLATLNIGPAVPWRAFDYAGLKPQLRVRTRAQTNVNATVAVSPSFDGANLAGASRNHNGGDDTAASPSIAVNGGPVPLDSLWGSIPGGYTLYDYFMPGVRAKISGGNTLTIWQTVVAWDLRWVG